MNVSRQLAKFRTAKIYDCELRVVKKKKKKKTYISTLIFERSLQGCIIGPSLNGKHLGK